MTSKCVCLATRNASLTTRRVTMATRRVTMAPTGQWRLLVTKPEVTPSTSGTVSSWVRKVTSHSTTTSSERHFSRIAPSVTNDNQLFTPDVYLQSRHFSTLPQRNKANYQINPRHLYHSHRTTNVATSDLQRVHTALRNNPSCTTNSQLTTAPVTVWCYRNFSTSRTINTEKQSACTGNNAVNKLQSNETPGHGENKQTVLSKIRQEHSKNKTESAESYDTDTSELSEQFNVKRLSELSEQFNVKRLPETNLNKDSPNLDGDFVIFYSYPNMRGVRFLSRLKIYQTVLTLLLVPCMGSMYTLNQATLTQVGNASLVSVFAMVMLYFMSDVFSHVAGYLSLSTDQTTVRVSHLNFWGRRTDTYLPIENIIPLSETSQKPQDVYVKLLQHDNKQVFYYSLKHGILRDKQLFELAMGKII